mgnify:CR=1 FL=1
MATRKRKISRTETPQTSGKRRNTRSEPLSAVSEENSSTSSSYGLRKKSTGCPNLGTSDFILLSFVSRLPISNFSCWDFFKMFFSIEECWFDNLMEARSFLLLEWLGVNLRMDNVKYNAPSRRNGLA